MKIIEPQKIQHDRIHQTEKLEMAIGSLGTELLLLENHVKSLNRTITEANAKNDKLQRWFLWLTIIGVLFAATGIVQAVDIFARGIGK